MFLTLNMEFILLMRQEFFIFIRASHIFSYDRRDDLSNHQGCAWSIFDAQV